MKNLDEEVGGVDGMRIFVTTKDFTDMNVGVALDEGTSVASRSWVRFPTPTFFCETDRWKGLASPTDEFIVYYGERNPWCEFETCQTCQIWQMSGVRFKATGPTGHASRFIENTALDKLVSFFCIFFENNMNNWISNKIKVQDTNKLEKTKEVFRKKITEKAMRKKLIISQLEIVRKAAEFRKEQFDTLHRGQHECGMKLGDVTTINLTVLKVI